LRDRGELGKRDKTEKDIEEEDVRNTDEDNDDRRQETKIKRTQRREEGLGVINDEIKTE
jgi:hypothetical protein